MINFQTTQNQAKLNKIESHYDLPAGVCLRNWQEKALRRIAACEKQNFLLVAVPAAGKTLLSLLVGWQFLREQRIKRIVVVCPTNHLRYQWAEAAHTVGLNLDPEYSNADGRESPDYHGVVVTYQQVASVPDLFRANCRDETLVVFDEIHHAGDELTWGRALRQAFEPAVFRLGLSGTPFRSDANAIPFVDYVNNRCEADFVYGYGSALADGVVRAVYFPTIEGTATWLGSDGKFKQRSLLDAVSGRETSERWRTILDPNGDWLRDVIKQADENLTEMRKNGHGEAAGLIVAIDRAHAERLVSTVEVVTGTKPALAIHDKPDAGEIIKRFIKSHERWIVAVRMVSEGVDIPRLRVCVYATNVCSELFLIQVIGRLLRKQAHLEEQTAALYLPYIAELIKYAERIKEIREHILTKKSDFAPDEQNQANSTENGEQQNVASENARMGSGTQNGSLFLPISSQSKLHHTIFDGEQFTREELRQAEQINGELGVPFAPVLSAAILRRGMAMGAVEVVQSKVSSQTRSSLTNNNFSAMSSLTRRKVNFFQQGFESSADKILNENRAVPIFVQQKTLRKKAHKLAGQLAFALDIEIEDVHRSWIEQGGMSQSKATVEELRQKVEWLARQLNEASNK